MANIQAPINRLPPELLAEIFDCLVSPNKTICEVVCHTWRKVIITIYPQLRQEPNDLLCYAAENGYIFLLNLAKARGAKRFNLALWCATRGGHIKLIELLNCWGEGPEKYALSLIIAKDNRILNSAAITGQIGCMKLAKKWGATDFNYALSSAARGGHIDCMKLAKKWGATEFNGALNNAARGGHLDCLTLAKEWGAREFDVGLRHAASRGHLDCLKLLKEWGATAFNQALNGGDHAECMKLLKKWQNEAEKSKN